MAIHPPDNRVRKVISQAGGSITRANAAVRRRGVAAGTASMLRRVADTLDPQRRTPIWDGVTERVRYTVESFVGAAAATPDVQSVRFRASGTHVVFVVVTPLPWDVVTDSLEPRLRNLRLGRADFEYEVRDPGQDDTISSGFRLAYSRG